MTAVVFAAMPGSAVAGGLGYMTVFKTHIVYGTTPQAVWRFAVPPQDKLVSVIDTVIEAMRQGELDDLLSKATTAVKPAGKRKAAA